MGNISQNEARSKTFNNVGVYTLLCNLHPNMKGYVVVVPSAHFAKVDAEGKFVLKGLPDGAYDVTAWAPGTKPETKPVAVHGNTAVDFETHR